MLRLIARFTFIAFVVASIGNVDAQPAPDASPAPEAEGSGSGTAPVTPRPASTPAVVAPTDVTVATVPAGEPQATDPKPSPAPHVISVLPDITLKGDNNGPAKATLGVTATIPSDEDNDVNIGAAFSTKTQDGLAQLLAIDSGGVHPTDFGGEVSFSFVALTKLPSAFALQHRLAAPEWDVCNTACEPAISPQSPFCAVAHPDYYTDRVAVANAQKTLTDLGRPAGPLKRGDLLPPKLLCEDGKKAMEKAVATDPVSRDLRAVSPKQVVSMAARVGYAEYKWIGAGGDAGELVKDDEHHWSWSAGARLMRRRGWMTGDGLLAISRGYQASSTTAKWCSPAGMVPRPDNSGSDTAETCRESPFGAPTESTTVQAGGFFGYFDEGHTLFRATIGPVTKITFPAKGKTTFEAGGALPIYINTNLMPDEKGVFKGIVRVTPRIVYTRDSDGEKAWQFLVSLELLTGRSMFPMASDLL